METTGSGQPMCAPGLPGGGLLNELPGSLRSPTSALSAPCAAHAEHLSQEALHNHFHSLLSLSLCVLIVVHCNKSEAMCLGPGASVVKSLSRARGPLGRPSPLPCPHHYPSGPYSPACTGLLQFCLHPRCGDHLQERIREVCYSVSRRPPNHNWTQADGSAMRGPTLPGRLNAADGSGSTRD